MKAFCLLLFICLAEAAYGQSSPRFTLSRSVIAGGGASFSGGSRFQLAGTIAQSLAAVPTSSRFCIQGGFWIWPAPIIFAPAKVGTNFLFAFQSEPGQTYTVSYSSSLSGPNWQWLGTIAGDGSVKTITNPVAGATQRFYRLVQQ